MLCGLLRLGLLYCCLCRWMRQKQRRS